MKKKFIKDKINNYDNKHHNKFLGVGTGKQIWVL